jgi:hypothetical protein
MPSGSGEFLMHPFPDAAECGALGFHFAAIPGADRRKADRIGGR